MRTWFVALMLLTGTAASASETPEQIFQRATQTLGRGDLITGMGLLRKSAEAGHAPAQARLGDILDKAEEDKEAVAWYRKAAEQGNAAGEFGLGMEYASGEGVPKDMEQAREWVLRAAEQGHQSAVETLAMAYRIGGLGLAPDAGQARIWGERAESIRAADPRQAPVKQADNKARKEKQR